MSTRLQNRPPPPTPPPTAPKPNPNPHRKKKRPPKGRREPYPTKKKDQATIPVHTPNSKEEDKEKEDSALIKAVTTLTTVKTDTSRGLDTSFLDIKDITDVIILSRKEKQKQKDIDKRLQQENKDRAEFGVLEYAVE